MIEEVASRLKETLAKERSAIVALDTPSLASLEAEKMALLDDLKRELSGSATEIQGVLAPIFVEAEINALLLRDAVSAMSSLLGITQSGVYDRAAKTSRATASARRRVA
jgi:hypothetical protein